MMLAPKASRQGGVIAAIFSSWWKAATAFAAAAGVGTVTIRPDSLPKSLIPHQPDRESLFRLHPVGGWFTADPIALEGCLGRATI